MFVHDILDIWFGIANRQISSIFERVIFSPHSVFTFLDIFTPPHSVFSFLDDNLSKCKWILTKLGMYIDILEI